MNATDFHWTAKPPLGYGLNLDHPLAQGLTGAWLFREGSGSVYDDTGYRAKGTLNAGISWGRGPHGWVLRGDGTSGQVLVTDSSQLRSNTVRGVSFWFSPAAVPADAVAHRLLACADGTVGNAWQVVYNPSNNAGSNDNGNIEANVAISSTVSDKSVASTSSLYTLVVGTWYHVVVTWDSTPVIQHIYINGQDQTLTTQVTTNLSTAATAGLAFLAKNDNSRWTQASMELVYLWSRQPTQADVNLLYREPYALVQAPNHRRWFAPAAAATALPGGWQEWENVSTRRALRESRFVLPGL